MSETSIAVSDLEGHVAEYVARAAAGERFVVCAEGAAIAELSAIEKRLERLEVRPAERPWGGMAGWQRIPTKSGVDLVALLREDRDQS